MSEEGKPNYGAKGGNKGQESKESRRRENREGKLNEKRKGKENEIIRDQDVCLGKKESHVRERDITDKAKKIKKKV